MWLDLTKAGFHTQNGKADFSPPLNFYINELTIHVCIIANGTLVCFSWGSFFGPVWHARVLRWYSNGSYLAGQAPTWLEIITWLANKLGHQFGYYLWYLELKWASGETIWQVSTSTSKKNLPLCSSPPPQTPPLNDHLWSYGKHVMYLQNNYQFTKTGQILYTNELTGMRLTKFSLIKHIYCYQTP